MSACDRDSRSARYHSRPRNVSGVNRVAQVHCHKRPRAHIAHRRETGHEGYLGVLLGGEGLRVRSALERIDRVVLVRAGAQVGVAIDQAGEYCGLRQINHIRAGRNLSLPRWLHQLDALAFDHDHNVLAIIVASGIEQFASLDVGNGGRGLRCGSFRRGGIRTRLRGATNRCGQHGRQSKFSLQM